MFSTNTLTLNQKNYSTEELVNLTSSQLLELIQEAKQASVVLGMRWAQAKRHYKNLKGLMPSFLAAIQLEIMKHDKKTPSQARIEAVASLHYQSKIKEANQAEFEMSKAEVGYRSTLKTLEAISSICYVRNNELKLAR